MLLIILTIQTLKAESYGSALSVDYYIQKDKEYSIKQKYELASILYEEGEYAKAFKKILPLLQEETNDYILDVRIRLLAGQIMRRTEDYKKSLSYLKKSLVLFDRIDSLDRTNINHDVLLAKNYLLISDVYRKYSTIDSTINVRADSSKYFLNKVIEINSPKNEIIDFKARAYMNLGNSYLRSDSLNKAEFNIKKAIDIHEILKNNMSLALSYTNLANVYVNRGDFKKGRELYGQALTYLKNEKSEKAIQYKELLYDNIAWALYNLKDYMAYKYVTDSYAIRDSLNTDKLKKDIRRIEAKHNVDMAVQQEQMKTELQERKTWIIGITGIVVSLLLLYLANLYKLRQQSLSLKLSKSQLEQQRNLERLKSQSQVKILNATIDGKETERKQIAEILHDNVSALLSSANMHLQASQKQFKDTAVPIELAKTQEIILEASQKIRELSHNLMSSVLLKFGLEYAVKDAAKKFSNSSIRINTAIHNVYRYSQEYEIKIFNIIQELINNILKHSEANNAYIIMEEEDDALNIIVKDDGKGFKNKSEEEKGVGINQIKARINMMNGTFLIESSKGQGTKTTMSIPVVRSKTRVYSA